MVKVALLSLFAKSAIIILGLSSCARSAPELPDASKLESISKSSQHIHSDCKTILGGIGSLESEKRELEFIIASNRGRNQTAGYFGALFIVPVVAVENNTPEKERLDVIQMQLDELRVVGNKKYCFF